MHFAAALFLSLLTILVAMAVGSVLGVFALGPVSWVAGGKPRSDSSLGTEGARPWEADRSLARALVSSVAQAAQARSLPPEGVTLLQRSPGAMKANGTGRTRIERGCSQGTDLLRIVPVAGSDGFRARGTWVRGLEGADGDADKGAAVPTHAETLEGHAWVSGPEVHALLRGAGGLVVEARVRAGGLASVVHVGPRGSMAGPATSLPPKRVRSEYFDLSRAADAAESHGSRESVPRPVILEKVRHPRTRQGHQATDTGLVRSQRALLRHPLGHSPRWAPAHHTEQPVPHPHPHPLPTA